MRLFTLSLMIVGASVSVMAQDEVFRVPVSPSGNTASAHGVVSGDSLLLSVTQSPKTMYFWVSTSGGREFSLPAAIGDRKLFAIGGKDTTFYYFFEATRKKFQFGAATEVNGEITLGPSMNEIKGRVYGRFVENGHLFLLIAEKSSHTINLLEYDGLRKVKETKFLLSIDIGKKANSKVGFYDNNLSVLPEMATAEIKVIKEDNAIWLTVDEQASPYPDPDEPKPILRTTWIKLDRSTGQSSNRIFFGEDRATFGSTYYRGKLYRFYCSTTCQLQIFDWTTGKQEQSLDDSIFRGNSESLFTHRDGETRKVFRTNKILDGLSYGRLMILDSLESGGRLFLSGWHYQKDSGVPTIIVAGFPAASLFGELASMLLNEANSQKILSYRYFILKDGTVEETREIHNRQQRIDEFELAFKNPPFTKSYHVTRDHTFAVYAAPRQGAVQVVVIK